MLSQSDPTNCTRTWTQLSTLVTIALERVEAGEFVSVAAALKAEMPTVIAALRETIVAPASTHLH